MLILTRRINEVLVIGDDVTVRVLGVKGNQIRLGIKAPRSVVVDREEIYKLKQKGITKTSLAKSSSANTGVESKTIAKPKSQPKAASNVIALHEH